MSDKGVLVIALLIFGITGFLVYAYNFKPDSAVIAKLQIEQAGYTNVRVIGYSWFGCGQGDIQTQQFSAIGLNQQPVEGYLCGGWLKGRSIRLK
jgi:hypothetical protein